MLGGAYGDLTFKFKLLMELAIGIGGALAILAISKYSKLPAEIIASKDNKKNNEKLSESKKNSAID